MIAKEILCGFGVKSTRLSDGSDDMEARLLLKAPLFVQAGNETLPTLPCRRAIAAYFFLSKALTVGKWPPRKSRSTRLNWSGLIEVGEVASAQNY